MTTPGVDYWSGHQYGWRYMAHRVDGTGAAPVWLDNELPLQGVRMTDVRSGPPQLTATISPRVSRLIAADGLPLLHPWRTAIYAEQDGIIRYGGLLVASGYDGPEWRVDGSGFTSYAKGMGYEGDVSFVETDALDIVRHIWSHIQLGAGSNIGLVPAQTMTGVPVGKALVPSADGTTATVSSTDQGPYRLVRWQNDDLGGDIDTLAQDTPFDYHERHQWDATKTNVEHYLDFGYPRMGSRKPDLRFVLGENIQTIPTIDDDGGDFANHVRVLGAGEGSEMIVAEARSYDGGLRRMVTVDRKDITDQNRALLAARAELQARSGLTTLTQVAVRDSPMAPFGSYGVGDEIRVQIDATSGSWMGVDLWFVIQSMTITPEDPELVGLELMRADAA